jgi:large subunit ribosomal protein L17
VKKLFDNIAPRSTDRNGGYTRIIKLGPRPSDSAPVAFLEWVDAAPATEEKPAKKGAKERAPKAEKPSAAATKPAPAEKEATTATKEPETTAAPAEEPKPKKRKWFGRKSSDEK